jgi:signal transduction histidine kinase
MMQRKQAEMDRDRFLVEVQKARDRLENHSLQLVQVQEAERRRIARELHDEIGQSLTALRLSLEMCEQLPPEASAARLRDARRRVDELVGRVRELSLNLRPAMLDDLGLLPALLWHFDRYTAQTGIAVVFKHSGLEGRRFASELETAAYRITQEALTNVARHARVREATVRLWTQSGSLCVQIEDHGTGFDPKAVLRAGHSSGLSGMRERASLLGGRLVLDSIPGVGTHLTVEFPLPHKQQLT